MALNSGNIYSIPEHPTEEDFEEANHCKELKSVTETVIYTGTKKISSTSLPEKPQKFPKDDMCLASRSIPTLIRTEIKFNRDSQTECRTFKKDINRLSVSLIDIPKFINANPDSGTSDTDKGIASRGISVRSSKSYLEVEDCISHLNSEPEYETLLSSSVVQNGNSNSGQSPAKNSGERCFKERKFSDNLVFIDLNEDSSTCFTSDDASGLSASRPRSRSMQWIQNTFQNFSNKFILEIRRPSDIAEERMRKSQEDLDMEEYEYTASTEDAGVKSKSTGRRFSENEIGKQKKSLPFRLGNLKDLWNRNHHGKTHIDRNIDQTRTDVCPLFNFPRNRNEDEQILDALRQAMRKCTAIDPSTRPTSHIVLEQLVKLADAD